MFVTICRLKRLAELTFSLRYGCLCTNVHTHIMHRVSLTQILFAVYIIVYIPLPGQSNVCLCACASISPPDHLGLAG